ncbi:hypothetical protein TRFO_08127 [Tritrichomonas foetus]|uniref:Uncharacterized protein n=1 Tax=Tritrichomonas foetus TaxID=1144522 RepID=A0A1J4JN62_9EUKA|nr:hypothetical protein TRFO_08127 [Tritrichomonas foetus]|eukprot:OHT00130.1 hypothetical protein TRFO_08127 [Tritrichomonas foetus]
MSTHLSFCISIWPFIIFKRAERIAKMMISSSLRAETFDQKDALLSQLDRQLMIATEKLLMKNKLLQMRQREVRSEHERLEEKKREIIRNINIAFPIMRRKAQEMSNHHFERVKLTKNKVRSLRDQLSTQLERQIRYRHYKWKFNQPVIYDQIDAFLDLLAYTHQNLPVKDIGKWACIERSISFNFAQTQRIKIQLKSLAVEYSTGIHELFQKMEEIEARQENLKKKDILRHQRFQYYLDQFAKEDEQMIEGIESQFRSLLQKHNERTRKAQFRAADRLVEARRSGMKLQDARDKYMLEKCPLLAIEKQLKIISQNKSITRAKLRVDRIILDHLQAENDELNERLNRLKGIMESSS